MPAPIATIPLYELLTGITALGAGKNIQQTLENLDEGQLEQRFTDTFRRLLLGPLASVRHTPSGLVIGPETPEQAKPGILATFPEAEQGIQTTSTPIPTGTPKGIVGLPMPETQEKLKGFEKPQDVDTSVLMINKIPTWEKYFKTKEDFEKIAKENNITVEELEKAAIAKQITFKRQGYDYDIYFDGKLIGELNNATKASDGEIPRSKYGDAYNINFIDSLLSKEGIDTFDGLNYAKNRSKELIASSLLDKTSQDSLANIFPNIKYDKKGKPIEYIFDEKIENEYLTKFINALETKDSDTFDKIRNYDFEDSPLRSENFKNTIIKYIPKVVDLNRQEYIDKQNFIEKMIKKNNPSDPVGSLIDKPLSNE